MAKEPKGITIPESLAQVADRMKDHMEAQKAQRSAYAASAHSQKNPPNFNQTCKGWAKKDGWSLREAANLLSRCNPDRPHDLEGQKALNVEIDKLYQYMLSHANKSLVLVDPDAFQRNYKVRPLMLVEWAANHDVEIPVELASAVLAPILNKLPRQAPLDASVGEQASSRPYSTRLLRIQQAAIEEFWADFDESRPPSSKTVVGWLQEKHGVSQNEAKAIDKIIRAEDRKTGGITPLPKRDKGDTRSINKK